MSFFKKFFSKEKEQELEQGLEKTKSSLFQKISKAVAGKAKVDVEVLDELESALISSDVGLDTTIKIIERIEARVARDKYLNVAELNSILKEEISGLLTENNTVDLEDFILPEGKKPYVLLVVGVNGVGKTTTIGKLAYQYKQKGYSVLLGAGDTFRAAAVDQLKVWSERVGCAFFSKGMDTDPAAVAFEAVQEGIRSNADVVIIDTAGRLHTKTHLMRELTKIHKSIDKCLPGAPHDVMLVLDATTGQNALQQARAFKETAQVTGIILAKLDSSAKGGMAFAIQKELGLPILFAGLGERPEDLQPFDRAAFVDGVLGLKK